MDARELSDLVAHGQVDALTRRLGGLNESQRKALAPGVRQLLDYGNQDRYPAWPLVLAALGCLGGERQVARGLEWVWRYEVPDDGTAAQVLRERDPHWLEKLPSALLGDESRHWALLRRLVRDGVVSMPDEPAYYLGMITGVLGPAWLGDATLSVRDALISDADLLDRELWQMLATERVGRALARVDGWLAQPRVHNRRPMPAPTPETTWSHALVSLAAAGRIDRARLLDVTLAAPLRDWAAVDVTWFLGLQEALAPTPDEVIARQATYVRWLACDHGTAVKSAQKLLMGLLGDERIEPLPVVDASRATLSRTDKTTVATQLKLLRALAGRHPEVAEIVADAVSVALEHPRPDVREQAQALMRDLGRAASVETSSPAFVAPEPLRLDTPDPVTPVADADELGDLLLRLLEEVDEPLDLERAYEGVVRVAAQPPNRIRDVLLRRATENAYSSLDPRGDAGLLARAWLEQRSLRGRFQDMTWRMSYTHAPHTGSMVWFQHLRLGELLRAVRARSGRSVALPTYADGTLAADVLAGRLASLGKRDMVGPADLSLALMRVSPDELSEELVPRRLRKAWVSSTITLLRDWSPRWQRVVGTSKGPMWFSRDTRVLTFRNDSRPALDLCPVSLLADRREALATAGWDMVVGAYEPRFEQLLALWSTCLPHHHDLYAAHMHPLLFHDLTKDRGTTAPVMDALARGRRRIGPVESSALVLGLAAKDVRGRTAAVDAILDLARRGVLDGCMLGGQASVHLRDGTIVGRRLVDGLRGAAEASDAAALPVLSALETLLPVVADRRDCAAFLELSADLVDRCGQPVRLPQSLVDVATSRSTSLAARAARRLV